MRHTHPDGFDFAERSYYTAAHHPDATDYPNPAHDTTDRSSRPHFDRASFGDCGARPSFCIHGFCVRPVQQTLHRAHRVDFGRQSINERLGHRTKYGRRLG